MLAMRLIPVLGRHVHKQEVHRVLKSLRHTRKLRSTVVYRSRPNERQVHLQTLASLWTNDNMVRYRFQCCARLLVSYPLR